MQQEHALHNLQLALIELEYAIGDLECVRDSAHDVRNDGRFSTMISILSKFGREVQDALPVSAKSVTLDSPLFGK
jgi:hypothetical protein